MEQEQQNYVQQRKQELVEKYHRTDPTISIEDDDSQELVLREISFTLAQRKKLHSQVSRLENELEKMEERNKQANQMSMKTQSQGLKANRKSRDHRIRTQDWPDVPDIGKIEEQNPEILAQKILETGRKIEASKLIVSANNKTNEECNKERGIHKNYSHQRQPKLSNNSQMMLMANAPKQRCPKTTNQSNINQNRTVGSEPPRVNNFEDRLKSIITSVLNEDEQYRSKQTTKYPVFNNEPAKLQASNHKPMQYMPDVYQNNQQVTEKKMKEPPAHEYKHAADMYNEHLMRQEKLTNPMSDCNRKDSHDIPTSQSRSQVHQKQRLMVEQPDYTQVSPAKLALRRHLSQEKLAAQQSVNYQQPDGGLVATRTIGDLMSGEIERTLEISNQSIINAAVDMSDIHGTTTVTPRSVVNQNIPPRPERVNIKLIQPGDVNKEASEQRPLYSPISRPSSTEGNLEGLAYLHHAKSQNVIMPSNSSNVPPHLSTTSVLPTQNTSRSNIQSYQQNANGGMFKMMANRHMPYPKPIDDYTPLPRADIKPYQESYFTDSKPPVSIKIVEEPRSQFVPEGLAATLHARVLNTSSLVKEENTNFENTRRESLYNDTNPENPKLLSSNNRMVNIKLESGSKSPVPFYPGQKRISPIIQGPTRRADGDEVTSGRHGDNIVSPESHSNTSTPLVDEVPEKENPPRQQQEEGNK